MTELDVMIETSPAPNEPKACLDDAARILHAWADTLAKDNKTGNLNASIMWLRDRAASYQRAAVVVWDVDYD